MSDCAQTPSAPTSYDRSPHGDPGQDRRVGSSTCPCTCDWDVLTGPATLAAPFLRRLQVGRVDTTAGPADGSITTGVLMFIARTLRDDAPVHLDVADCATRLACSAQAVLGEAAWLAEHQFLAWDADAPADGVARLWVNPSVTFLPWTDPRVAAARHRFPFITTADMGMAAREPVVIRPYDRGGWHAEYVRYLELTQRPHPALSPWCCAGGSYAARCNDGLGSARL